MSTRLSVDLLFIGLIGAAVGWAARAPAQPQARAAYLCRPVIVAATTVAQLEALAREDEGVVPPTPPWRSTPGEACQSLVVRVSLALQQ